MKYFHSKKISLVILGVTAFVCSRAFFFLFDDPEGPNLLIVTGLAVILFAFSSIVYFLDVPASGFKRFLFALCIQIVLVAGFYLFLR